MLWYPVGMLSVAAASDSYNETSLYNLCFRIIRVGVLFVGRQLTRKSNCMFMKMIPVDCVIIRSVVQS